MGACKDRKARLRESYSDGQPTEDWLKIFLKAIDVWFSLYVEGWTEDGDAIETSYARKSKAGALATSSRKRAAMPEILGPYKRGKWDDVVPPDEGT